MSDWQDMLREASQLRRVGRIQEAIAAYKRLLTTNPDLPDSWYNLAWLQHRARAFDEALASYQQALDRGVQKPEEVHLNRAVILSDHLRRPADAELELRSALSLNPGYVPAMINLGNLCEDLGDREGAREAYERVLGAEPGNNLALARIAGLSHSATLDHALADKLQAAIDRPGGSAGDRADLGFALAGLLDAAGQFQEAFAAASAANQASGAASGARYDRAAAEKLVDRLIETFREAVCPGTQPAPIFIVGMFRSGSTLVEQILGSHSQVTGSGELDLIPHLAASIRGYPEAVPVAHADTVAQWRESYLAGIPSLPARDRHITDKRPDNFLHVGLVKTLFPSAKIIHTRRNALDNLVSLYFLHLGPGMPYALDLDDAAHWYRQYSRLMEHWKSLYAPDIFDVDYDKLVHEPRPVVEGLLKFLGITWEDAVLDFETRRSAVKTASVWQVREPLHARSSGRWRNYEAHLSEVARRLVDDGEAISPTGSD